MKSLLVVVLVALMPTMFAQGDPPIVQAHRGYSDAYPENTLLAFERAFAVGADRVETVVKLRIHSALGPLVIRVAAG